MSVYLGNGNPGKILEDLPKLRDHIGGLVARQRNGVMYNVKSAKELVIKMREAADELGMVMVAAPVDIKIEHLPMMKDSKDRDVLVCSVTGTYRFMSSDGSYVDYIGIGYGTSNDDKAAGKASTYAEKDATTKGLCLPDDEMVDTDDISVPVVAANTKKFNFKKD